MNYKNQNIFFKFILFVPCLLLMVQNQAFTMDSTSSLAMADSLFHSKKYTESFDLYEKIMEQNKQATPQMLMKMAYIKEGLGDYSMALVYLNEYYELTSDKRARFKMSEIADEQKLTGFTIDDSDLFIAVYNQYYFLINGIVFSIAGLLLLMTVYRKIKNIPHANRFAVSTVVFLLIFLYVTNFLIVQSRGIISQNHAYLMSGPSAGADLIEVAQKGHRITILEDQGYWLKIEWEDQEAYIKSSKVNAIN